MGSYRLVAVTVVLLAGASDCTTSGTKPVPASAARGSAADGLAAFAACDLRTASQDFAAAHSLDPARADYALAYALSTLAILPEDPAVTAVLRRLGFDGPIDSSMLWGAGGMLDQLAARTATCTSIADYARSRLPYAAAKTNGPSAASIVNDPTLNGNDFVNAAIAISPRIQKIVDALEQAAGGMNSASITGGCGVGTVTIQPPELYGLAGILEGFVAAVQAAQGYDWGVPATLLLDWTGQEQPFSDSLDAHFFHVTSPAAIESARPIAQRAVRLVQEGAVAAASIGSRPPNSLFNWADAPPNVLTDVETLANGVQTLLTAAGLQSLPFFSPALAMDGRSFFDHPVDMTNVSPPIWAVVTTTDPGFAPHESVASSSTGADPQLMPRFSPYPFGVHPIEYSLTLTTRWQNVTADTWTEIFNPDARWQNAFGCTN